MTYGLLCRSSLKKLPLKSVTVHVTVKGFVAQTECTLHYHNDEENSVEAIFKFPLDEGSAVYKFEAEINGHRIVSECQEKEQARETYKDAIAKKNTAILLEEDSELGDVFQINLGNLHHKTDAKLTLALVTELPLEGNGVVRYTLPVVLNPRYCPSLDRITAGKSSTLFRSSDITEVREIENVDGAYKMAFTGEVVSSSPIENIEGNSKSSLNVKYESNKKKAMVSLAEEFKFDHDITMLISYQNPCQPQAIFEKGIKDASGVLREDVLMMNFFPDLNEKEKYDCQACGEFYFIVDRSGSMKGSKILQAKETLLLFLKSLPVGCYFNIIGFGSSFEVLFKNGSVPYSEDNLTIALKYQKSISDDMGGTEILRPLSHVYSQKTTNEHPRQIFLMTDGEVRNTRQVIDLVKKNADNTRVFTFGIGYGASTSLINGVAKAGRGRAEFVSDQERLQGKVMSVLKNSLQPSFTNGSLEWDLPQGVTYVQVPQEMPALFLGQRLILYAVLHGLETGSQDQSFDHHSRLTMTGKIADVGVEHKLELNLKDKSLDVAAPLHRLMAKVQIQHLQLSEGDQEKDKIILISKSANVISRYTSFVAIDKESNVPVSVVADKKMASIYRYLPHLSGLPVQSQRSIPLTPRSWNCARGRLLSTKEIAMNSYPKVKKHSWKSDRSFAANAMENVEDQTHDSACNVDMKFYRQTESAMESIKWPTNNACNVDLVKQINDKICRMPFKFSQRRMCDTVQTARSSMFVGDEYETMVSAQNFDGSWNLTEAFAVILGTSQKDLEVSNPVKSAVLWATALAITWLQVKYAERENEWEMLVKKAMTWLARQDLEGKSSVELLEDAKKQLRN